jgi:hypothetical protein
LLERGAAGRTRRKLLGGRLHLFELSCQLS